MHKECVLHQRYRVDRDHLVEVIGLAEVSEEEPLPYPITDQKVEESEHIHHGHATAVHVIDHDVCEEPGIWEESFYKRARIQLVDIILEIRKTEYFVSVSRNLWFLYLVITDQIQSNRPSSVRLSQKPQSALMMVTVEILGRIAFGSLLFEDRC